MTSSPQRPLSGQWLAIAFLLLAAGIGALWYSAISAYEAAVLRERGRELQATAELKIEFIRFWLEERRSDAIVQSNRPLLAIAAAGRSTDRWAYGLEALPDQLEQIRKEYGYEAVLLLDRQGNHRFGAGKISEYVLAAAAKAARIAMETGQTAISRAYHSEMGVQRHLDIDLAAPVADSGLPGAPIVGALVFHLDPKAHLDPFLRRWPAPSESGETILVERTDGELTYLSSLRHADAENLKRHAGESTLPAAVAARGGHGITEGIDYRGVPVLAAVGQVPGMPWFVVSKLDREEILAPVRREALWSGTLASLLAMALGLAMLAWYRRGQSELALAQQAAARDALASSEARFRRLHEHGWDFNAMVDRDMIIRYVSPALDRYLGHHALGGTIGIGTARVHPEDVARVEAARQAALRQPGNPQFVEHRFAKNGGGWLTVEACFTNHLDDPDIGALVYTARDITERLEAERALHESEVRLQAIFEHAPLGIAIVNTKGRYVMVNPAQCRMLGYSEAELLGKTFRDITQADDADLNEKMALAMIEGRADHFILEKRYLRKDGQPIWVALSVGPVRDENGAVRYFVGLSLDITERKQAEAALRESEERYRILFNLSPDAVFAHRDNIILYANDAALRLFNATSSQALIGQDWHDLIAPEGWPAIERRVAALTSGEQSVLKPSEQRHYKTLDGRAIPFVEATGARIVIDGKPAIMSVIRDITERREAEARRLEYARQQRDTLVREVHHRIKNHLQGLAGLLRQHMHEQPGLVPVLQSFAAQVNAISIVHGLQGRTEKGDASLRNLAAEIATFLGGITGTQIGLTCPGPSCLWAVAEAEAVPLALILNELLTNALRHGTDKTRVSLSIECDEDRAQLVIRNPGRLGAGLDFADGKGLGTGLSLIRSLLPPEGVAFSLQNAEGGWVETRLELGPPVLQPMPQVQVVSLR